MVAVVVVIVIALNISNDQYKKKEKKRTRICKLQAAKVREYDCEELTEFTNGFDPEQGPEVFSISASNTSRNGPTS